MFMVVSFRNGTAARCQFHLYRAARHHFFARFQAAEDFHALPVVAAEFHLGLAIAVVACAEVDVIDALFLRERGGGDADDALALAA